jgi:outer membrane murein-binding lipoprotein Lpp
MSIVSRILAAAALGALLLAGGAASAQTGPAVKNRVVMQVSDADPG